MEKPNNLRIMFHDIFKMSEFNHLKIDYAHEHGIAKSISSRLIEINESNNIVAGLAKKFWWDDGKLYFELKDKIVSSKGDRITAYDVKNSFEKIIAYGKSTHVKFKDFFDCSQKCDFIDILSDTKFFLKPTKNSKQLIDMLVNPEASIFPSSAIKETGYDYTNTTGLYSFAEATNEVVIFHSNKQHYLYEDTLADQITLVLFGWNPDEIINSFKNNTIDAYPTYHVYGAEELNKQFADQEKFHIFKTFPLNVKSVIFTERGMTELSIKRRAAISEKIRKYYTSQQQTLSKPAYQFFSVYGDNLLSQKKVSELRLDKVDTSNETGRGIFVTAESSEKARYMESDMAPFLPDIVALAYNRQELRDKTYDDIRSIPHLYVSSVDSAFSDNATLMNYIMSYPLFDKYIENREEWLSNYISSDDKKRKDLIESLQEKFLSDYSIVPLMSVQSFAMAKYPWKVRKSKYSAGTPFWAFRYEP